MSIDIHVDDQEHEGFAGPMPTAENVIQAIHQDDVTILSLMLAEEPRLFKVGQCIKVCVKAALADPGFSQMLSDLLSGRSLTESHSTVYV